MTTTATTILPPQTTLISTHRRWHSTLCCLENDLDTYTTKMTLYATLPWRRAKPPVHTLNDNSNRNPGGATVMGNILTSLDTKLYLGNFGGIRRSSCHLCFANSRSIQMSSGQQMYFARSCLSSVSRNLVHTPLLSIPHSTLNCLLPGIPVLSCQIKSCFYSTIVFSYYYGSLKYSLISNEMWSSEMYF